MCYKRHNATSYGCGHIGAQRTTWVYCSTYTRTGRCNRTGPTVSSTTYGGEKCSSCWTYSC